MADPESKMVSKDAEDTTLEAMGYQHGMAKLSIFHPFSITNQTSHKVPQESSTDRCRAQAFFRAFGDDRIFLQHCYLVCCTLCGSNLIRSTAENVAIWDANGNLQLECPRRRSSHWSERWRPSCHDLGMGGNQLRIALCGIFHG